jgi:hypothetical protein
VRVQQGIPFSWEQVQRAAAAGLLMETLVEGQLLLRLLPTVGRQAVPLAGAAEEVLRTLIVRVLLLLVSAVLAEREQFTLFNILLSQRLPQRLLRLSRRFLLRR